MLTKLQVCYKYSLLNIINIHELQEN